MGMLNQNLTSHKFSMIVAVLGSKKFILLINFMFPAYSAYKMVLKSVNFVFFSVIITSAPFSRSANSGMIFFIA